MELSVGQVAKRAEVTVSALHFYEQKGMIASWRNQGNQRRYDSSVLRRIAVIKTGQQLGLSLEEIKQALASLPIDRAPSQEEWEAMGKKWKSILDDKIWLMTKLRDELGECIGCGCLSLNRCRLRNPDDELGALGNGATLWKKND
ncbi:redox-sensitive transcriptional activator SoxR [Vibrio hangzhouensis]|uniref:Redox-sensitive transcriptional activator SoxR n=1 Tax=Vibrio hangzhouensis TaxID=462991 RepID=A0A1H6C1H3_9VIBR|nr:redox-sensitive transcriptional activator SoxR [Vibrio hangzhouensis]SEG66829.1 MerR family transcriptional regulator, redox-sensitive transcriptional activator SoxR [Vibrio hangzhouensis]